MLLLCCLLYGTRVVIFVAMEIMEIKLYETIHIFVVNCCYKTTTPVPYKRQHNNNIQIKYIPYIITAIICYNTILNIIYCMYCII